MNILVTGGAGFIGSNFIHYWHSVYPADHIRVLDKLTYAGHRENLRDIENEIDFLVGDICDQPTVEKSFTGIDVVVHFAAETHVDRSIVGPAEFIRTNVVGTQVLLSEALKQQIKLFHHISTDEVFGELPLDKPELKFSETTPLNPHSPYSASKAASDMLVMAWHRTYGLPVTLTNTSNNYGPYMDVEKLIPRFITNLIDGQKIPLMGQGKYIRDWLYVEDHCRAIDLIIHQALIDQKIIGQSFCVGGNSERTNLQVAQSILKLLGKDESSIEYVPDRLGHDTRYAIDTGKINRVLGWNQKFNFDTGLAMTVEWYKKNELWWRPFKQGRPDIDPGYQQTLIHARH